MKKSKVIAIIVTVLMAVALFTACSQQPAASESPSEAASSAVASESASAPASSEAAAGPKGPGGYDLELGIIQPAEHFYYQQFADATKQAAEYCGMKVTIAQSLGDPLKEVANIEDFISKGVDAIAMFSLASDVAQQGAQKCNEAGIPLFLMSSVNGEGPGTVVCTIGNSWTEMGKYDGDYLAENVTGALNVLEIQGALGQGIAEGISEGFAEGIKARDDIKIVFQKTAGWNRDDAIKITEDQIAAGLDFNCIFVHNEDMCMGVVSVLKENDMLDKVTVITQNGSDDGFTMIQAGEVLATCANPPPLVASDVVVQILKYFDGVPVPETYDTPTFIVDASNVNDPNTPSWDIKWATKSVDEYFAGTYDK